MTTKLSLGEVLSQLTSAGLATPHEEEKIAAALASSDTGGSTLPWYVKLFVGIAAWVAAILITAFFFIIGMINEDQALIWGLVFCALAIGINRLGRAIIFFGQLSLAMSLTGQLLAMVGLFSLFDFEFGPIVIPIFILEAILIWLHRDPVLRFISTLVITAFILAYIFEEDILNALHALIFVLAAGALFIYMIENRLKLLGLEEMLSPVGSGLTVSFLGILILPLLDNYFSMQWWITTLLLFPLLLFLLTQIVWDLGHSLQSRAVFAMATGCLLLLIPAIRMPGLAAALLVLILGFWRNNRGLMGLSSVFLVFYIWAYYYSMEWTLLTKSLALLGSGILLLALRFYFIKATAETGESA